jgi:hypothetical protein
MIVTVKIPSVKQLFENMSSLSCANNSACIIKSKYCREMDRLWCRKLLGRFFVVTQEYLSFTCFLFIWLIVVLIEYCILANY